MPNCGKLLAAARNNPAGLRFAELIALAECLGWVHERTKGSHRIYSRSGYPIMTFQMARNGGAKEYQVSSF